MKIETIKSEIDEFILNLDSATQARTLRLLELLEKNGQNLSMPYSKSLKNGLFELRIIGKKHIRIIYCFHKNMIYLLHIFIKKQNRILTKDLEIANKRRKILA